MRALSLLKRGLGAFRRDRRGVSAVEFALIAPVLILTYFGLAELSSAMMAQRRASHSASAIGDLVAQSTTVTTANLTDMFSAATTILSPFPTSTLKLRVTSITGDKNGAPQVDWSRAQGTDISALTSVTGLPTGLISAKGDNVIMAESTYTYNSTFAFLLKNGLTFTEKFYLKPRQVAMVACSNC
jgi:Flp pilus assembly protein TadG